jgi:hypothetical protein
MEQRAMEQDWPQGSTSDQAEELKPVSLSIVCNVQTVMSESREFTGETSVVFELATACTAKNSPYGTLMQSTLSNALQHCTACHQNAVVKKKVCTP